jgi:hypothetical protein
MARSNLELQIARSLSYGHILGYSLILLKLQHHFDIRCSEILERKPEPRRTSKQTPFEQS